MIKQNTFNDAGDSTCMDCGRSRENCYCSIPFDDDDDQNSLSLSPISFNSVAHQLPTERVKYIILPNSHL